MSFWCLQIPPKNEWKQVDLRFNSNKVKFFRLFFGGHIGLKKWFGLCLTFSVKIRLGLLMHTYWIVITIEIKTANFWEAINQSCLTNPEFHFIRPKIWGARISGSAGSAHWLIGLQRWRAWAQNKRIENFLLDLL